MKSDNLQLNRKRGRSLLKAMLSLNKRHIAGLLTGFIYLLASTSLQAGLTVEQVQRDYQIRYYTVTGGYLTWPKCMLGNTPAPQYPKNGFYGDVNQDPVTGAELVQDLIWQFYYGHVIYNQFVKANGYSDLEGVSQIPMFTSSDMQDMDPTEVTTNNYMDYLSALASDVAKLKMVKVQASQITGPGDYKASPNQIWDSVPWGDGWDDHNVDGGWRYYFLWGAPPIGRLNEGNLLVQNFRGKISADLTRFKNGGSLKTFLKLSPIYLNYINPVLQTLWDCYPLVNNGYSLFPDERPTSSPENTYGLWAGGLLQLGSISSSDYVTYSDQPGSFPGADVCDHFGWQVADQVVVVTPDFTAIADSQDCNCTCNTGCDAGTTTTILNSIHVNVSLGNDNFGSSAGTLTLDAQQPSQALATPAALRYSVAGSVEIISADGNLQFLTSQVLANIQVNNDFRYTISFYTAANAGSQNWWDGLYQPVGDPYSTVTVENPDASSTSYNRLRVTYTSGSISRVTDYTYSSNGQWVMDTGNGLRRESKTSTWDISNVIRTEVVTVSDTNNQVAYKEINTYQLFPWGQEKVQNVVDPDGAALTSTWSYYTNPATDGGNYRQLQLEVDSAGHWTRHQYDQNGRETNRVTQFLNSAPSSSDSNNRVTATIYSTSAPQITTIEYLQGTEVKRGYQVLGAGVVKDIQCRTPGAAWNAADNLVSITTKFTTGSFAGQPWRVQNPDGTVRIYSYVTNATQKTITVLAGVADPNSSTHILEGTKTVTTKDIGGHILAKLVYYHHQTGSDLLVGRDIYTYLDDRERSYQVVHLDGTTNSYDYDCCGLDAQVDRDGTVTAYTYDDLKRLLTTTVNGITTKNLYDVNNNQLGVIRYGTDGTAVTNSMSTYDLAGRLASTADGLSYVTLFTNYFDDAGQMVRETIYANQTTRIETYAKDGSLLMVSGTSMHPVRYEYGIQSDGGVNRVFTKEIKLQSDLTDTTEWVKTYQDSLGRAYKTVRSDSAASLVFFNNLGQQTKTVDADGVTTLYQYNAKGELEFTAIDINTNGIIDFGGSDRITRTVSDVVADHGTAVRRTQTYVWATSGQDSPTLFSTSETSVDGLRSWNTSFGLTQQSQTAYTSNGFRYVTNTAPDNTMSVSVYQNGRLLSSSRINPQIGTLQSASYGYDAHGRMITVTDARTGTTTSVYDNDDRVVSVTTPTPSAGQDAQTTAVFFDSVGRSAGQLLPDGGTTINSYYDTGELLRTSGTRTYPVEYTYDYAGRVKTMKTWQDFTGNAGTATTIWNYDANSGFLTSKVYQDGHGPSYTYTPAGRLQTRTWARGVVTTYGYDSAGAISNISYSDGTAAVGSTYDRQGRLLQSTGLGTRSYAWNDAGELVKDNYTAACLGYSSSLKYGYDVLLRRSSLKNLILGSVVNYGYDAASRLASVVDGVNVVSYGYLANSTLVSNLVFQQNGTTRMTTTKQYDLLNRLTQILSVGGASPISSGYGYNSANQRTNQLREDGTYWVYQYDNLGQVISGKKYWRDSTPVAGQQFTYNFDDIGNRKTTAGGGDDGGLNLRSANYTNNLLNQITSRDIPGYVDVQGEATNMAVVTVNRTAAYRKDSYYRAELTVDNASAAVYQAVTNEGALSPDTVDVTGHALVRQTPEYCSYDLDGNLLADGRFNYTWDGENRLMVIESLTNAPAESKHRLEMSYDEQSRRLLKRVFNWNTATNGYQMATEKRYWYDGWNIIGQLDSASGQMQTYDWGLDLSGSLQGAGGVGGLVSMTVNSGTNAGTYFYGYDGNRNVLGVVNANDGTVAAQYDYDPFLRVTRASGALAFVNPFLSSTKFFDAETGLNYYGYRYYDSSTGRWSSRDPMSEMGGINLYGVVGNNPVNRVDPLGLAFVLDPVFTDFNSADMVNDQNKAAFNKWSFTPIGLGQTPDSVWVLGSGWAPNEGISDLTGNFIDLYLIANGVGRIGGTGGKTFDSALSKCSKAAEGGRISPATYGLKTISEDPALLRMWNDSLKSAASSTRLNAYQRYLQAVESGVPVDQAMLEKAFSTVNSRFLESARGAGYDIAEVHHWNFPKSQFPTQVLDTRNLVPTTSRNVHEILHRMTTGSPSDIWSGPISDQSQLILPDISTPLQ